MDFFKVDNWFLVLMFIVLGGFFVWAIQYILAGLKDSIKELDNSFKKAADRTEKLIEELFNNRNDHETRISIIERQCFKHNLELNAKRESGGRRWYDPVDTPPREHI